jgi:hypothetical protein
LEEQWEECVAELPSRPLAAVRDPETLGEDVADYVAKQERTPGAWKPSNIVSIRLDINSTIPRKTLLLEVSKKMGGRTPGTVCNISDRTEHAPLKDNKALCIPMVGKFGDIQDSFLKVLKEHPLVCPESIEQRCHMNKIIVFTDMHNSRWVLHTVASPPEPAIGDDKHPPEPAIGGDKQFTVVLVKWNPQEKSTVTETATMTNLLCSLTGHQPIYEVALGGTKSGESHVCNGIRLAQAEDKTGVPNALENPPGDQNPLNRDGPLGADVPDPGCEKEEYNDNEADFSKQAVPSDSDGGSDGELPTHKDDQGGGDLILKRPTFREHEF